MDAKAKKIYLIGGAAGLVIVGFIYFKNKSSGASSDSSSDIDPATGQIAGSAADEAALAAAGQGGEIDPATGDPYGSAADEAALASDDDDGDSAGALGEYTPIGTTTTSIETNAQWSQYAQSTLAAIGYDPETVAGAIGAYLGKIPETATQTAIVQVALAECGPPPQGTYSIIPTATTTTTATAMTTVPTLSRGETAGTMHNAIEAAGLLPEAAAGQEADWVVASISPASGTSVAKGSRVVINATHK